MGQGSKMVLCGNTNVLGGGGVWGHASPGNFYFIRLTGLVDLCKAAQVDDRITWKTVLKMIFRRLFVYGAERIVIEH